MDNWRVDDPQQRRDLSNGPNPVTLTWFFFLMFWWSRGGFDMPASARSIQEESALRFNRETEALSVLNQTRWGDFRVNSEQAPTNKWLNITGFRKEDNYAWSRLKDVQYNFQDLQSHSAGLEEQLRQHGHWEDDKTDIDDWVSYQSLYGRLSGSWAPVAINEGGPARGPRRDLNLSAIAPEIFWASEDFNRNITGSGGKATLSIEHFEPYGATEKSVDRLPRHRSETREISATLQLQDETSTGLGWDIQLHGIQFPKTGTLVLTTNSDKFHGIYGLPHLVPSQWQYDGAQRVLNETIAHALQHRQDSIFVDKQNFWSGDSYEPYPHCEFVVYAQVRGLSPRDLGLNEYHGLHKAVEGLEEELKEPLGRPIKVPPMHVSFTAFSPDCNFVIESVGPPSHFIADGEHLKGWKIEHFLSQVKSLLLVWAAISFGQALLSKKQFQDASTPSMIGRISIISIKMMTFFDFSFWVTTIMLGGWIEELYPVNLGIAFCCIINTFLGVRIFTSIHEVQAPEREAARRESERRQQERIRALQESDRSRGPTSNTNAPRNLADRLQPQQQVDDRPIVVPSDQDIDAEIAQNVADAGRPVPGLPAPNAAPTPVATARDRGREMLTKILPSVVGSFLLLILSISSASWSSGVRSFYQNTVIFVYLSFWWPQIFRNVQRNCRKPLMTRFIIGQSVLRLIPIAYFYCVEDNILFAETDPTTMMYFVIYIWLQIVILMGQQLLGPRFGVPRSVLVWLNVPEGWDYHPILREDDAEEGGMPIGLVKLPSNSPSTSRRQSVSDDVTRARKKNDDHCRVVDCAICMNVLEVPVLAAGKKGDQSGLSGILERKKYMVTPCRHVFHTDCLEGWMKYRLQCPNCREALPAL